MTRFRTARALAALLLLALALVACRREPADLAAVPGDPVGAVQAQVKALRDNDLVRYSRLSLPPELHARSEALWARRQAEAEPVDPEDAREYADMMARLTAPDAEKALMRDLEPKLAKFQAEAAGQWPLMQATASIFLSAAIAGGTHVGFKASGGIRSVADALLDLALVAQHLGVDALARARFRIGASSLLEDILSVLAMYEGAANVPPSEADTGGTAAY